MDSDCKEVSAIQDEDVLRRMWQQTEDFGKKKEIRAHMYKLREARLKEFYTSGEVLKDVQRSNSSPGLREQLVEKNQKWIEGGVTHADSLADHSFLSLKSKEIRDSESPTRDVQFRNSKNRGEIDGTWTVASKTSKSNDGKTIMNSQLATTQGSRPVDGGNLSYAAINQQEASVYTDGDANNFTKAVGESSKTFAQEQIVTGDENNFRTSKTVSSSSSSKFVSHSSSTTGNINMDDSLIRGQLQIEDGRSGTTRTIHNQDSSRTGRRQQETKTSVQESCQNQQHNQNVQESKSSTVTKRIQSLDTPNIGTQTTVVTKVVQGSDLPEDLKKNLIDGNTKVITETKTLPDGSTVTTTRYETKGSKKWSSTSGSSQVTSSNQRQVVEQKSSSTHVDSKQHDYVTGGNQNKTVITTATKKIDNYPDNAENIRIIKSENQDGGQIHITKHHENVHQSKVSRDDVQNITKQNVKDVKVTQDNVDDQTVKVTKIITTSEDHLQPVPKRVPQNETHTTVQTTKTSTTVKSDVEQAHVDKAQQVQHKIDIVVSKQERPKEPKQPVEKPKSPVKETPQKMEPAAARPQEIGLTKSCKPPAEQYKPSEPTEGQYSTTYRSEFTPKRISVDISPTHDAFVRSLRCKSPDRLSDRPNSRGQSTTSLRSSTSPEKTSHPSRKSPERKASHPSRKSPERKPSYDGRSPDKYTSEPSRKHNTSPSRPKDYSPENRYAKTDSSPDRVSKSPDRSYQRTSPSTTTKVSSYNTDTITRKKSSTNVTTRKSPERPITSSPTRSVSPIKSGPSSPTRNVDVIITTKSSKVTKTSSPVRGSSPNKSERSPSKSKDITENTTFNSDTITRKKKPEDGNKISKPIDLSNTTKTDTITRRTSKQTESVVTEIDKSIVSENIATTDIRKSKRPSSRDASPTTSVSDFEFVMHTNQQMVTDLDEPEIKYPEKRPSSLDIDFTTSTTTTIKRTEQNSTVSSKQPNSPVKESPRQKSPTKSSPVKSPTKASSPTKVISSPFKEVPKRTDYQPSAPELEPDEQPPSVFTIEDKITVTQIEPSCERPKSKEPREKPPLKRTETYEERCRKMLGLPEPEKPSTKEEIIPDEYAGRAPIEEPLFVKKHIDYGHPEDDIIKKTTDKIKSRKLEKKEPVDISEFITTEKNIESDILPIEDTLPKVAEPKLFSSPSRKSPEKQKPKDKKPLGEYATEYTDEYTDKPRVASKEPSSKHEKPITKEFSPELKSPQKDIEDLPGYMRPIPKVTPEDRDKMILQNRQRDISPEKQPKTTAEYPDEHIEQLDISKNIAHSITTTADKTIEKKQTRKSPERSPIQKQPQTKRPDGKHPEDRTFTTEYTDEYCEEKEISNKNYPTRKPSDKSDAITHTSDTKFISKTYKQIETPVRAKSPTKKPDIKKPKTKKPNEFDSSSSDDESIEVDEYYRTEVKTDIKSKDKKINRKSPSPVRRKPDLDRKSPEKDRESPSRSLPENVTVTEYINDYCETSKESELFDMPRKTTTSEIDFISKEKYDTDINLEIISNKVTETQFEKPSPKKQLENVEYDLQNENIQMAHVRTHRIDTTKINNETQPRETSPKRQPQKAVPSDTIECKFNKTTNKKVETSYEKKPQKPTSPEERSKSPTKHVKDVKKDNNKSLTKKTSSDIIETTKRRTTNETLKKKSSLDKSPERRSPSPTIKTNIKKVEETTRHVESITRKCSKKDIQIKNIPESKPVKISKAPDSPVRKPLYQSPATSPERKPIKQTPKPLQSHPVESSKKHVVTKTIPLSNRTDTKSQPSSPIKDTKPSTFNKTTPKTFTTIKTTKVTQPATITVTKITKTIATTSKQNSKKVESSDSESELGVEDLRAEINNKTSRTDKKNVITTAKINVTSPKHPSPTQVKSKQHPNVTMPIIQRSTSSREPSPDKICPVPVSSDDEYGHPRYPDQVSEPDDTPSKKKPQKITDIPLTEGEDVKDFNRITEVTETVTTKRTSPRITDIDKVTETDESLLSVTEKVSKFITTAEKLTEDEPKAKKPAPKVPRPELVVTEDLKEDECLLSVSDKVSKFINTAEQVSIKKHDKPDKPLRHTTNDFKVEENDECLKSVNEKVNRFIHAAETSKQIRTSPQIERTEITDLDDNLRTDECLLSVSDKVSKFLTTADKLTTESSKTKTQVFINKERERSPEKTELKRGKSPEKKPETPSLVHTPSRKSPERKSPEKEIKVHPEPRRETEPTSRPKSEPSQTLKSSEAVKKAKAMFENISKTQEIPKQRDILSRPSIWEGRKKPEQKPVDDSDIKLTDIGVYKKSGTSDVRKQLNYNQKEDVTLKSTKLILNEKKLDTKSKSPERYTPTCSKPKTSTTREEITIEENVYHRSKSPEKDDDIPGYMRPIPKVTTEERDQLIIESRIRESITPERNSYLRTEEQEEHVTEIFRSKPIENGDVPGYMRPLQRCLSPERDHKKSVREEEEIVVETTLPKRSYSPPEKDIPGYMKPLQRNASPDRDATDKPREYSPVPDDTPRSAKKFGVTLRRTDSGRMVPAERRRSSTPGQPVIEEIQDLEVLEKMMDKVVGYEQRRRIRAQIRVVKRLISENKITSVRRQTKTTSSSTRETNGSKSAPTDDRRSPVKKLPTDKSKPITESSITRERSKSPQTKKRPSLESPKITPYKKSDFIRERSVSPDTKRCLSQTEKEFKTESTFKSSSYTSSSRKIESRTSSKERSMSPDIKNTTTTTKVYKTDLKHVQPTKMSSIQPDKPSWVTNRNLKKTTDSVSDRKNVTVISKKKETPKRAYSPQKETKPTDCITSSYGIGPTDENGLPLFGIKALRKAADNVQVRGTVVTSEFYSENGNEPVGEVTVTKYSTDPKDLDIHDSKKKGFAAVTTTQKFGSRGAPSLKTLTDKKKAITDKNSEQDELIKTTSTKVTRRGSVKALSQKFIENAVETTTKEKQTCYPKAGLILRTSSFKDSSQPLTERSRVGKSSSRESSPGYESRPTKISLESITSDSRNFSSNTSTEHTKTFLNSHTRVTSAQDVISRMKNAEKEQVEGDTEEDREARMLLNKFLGAQVLMSGMEPLLGTGSSTQSAVSSSAQLVRKVQKTKTTSTSSNSNKVKDSSKQASVKQRFQCPITPEVLQDIWDEQTLRALLEQCTDYEERRAIRARLRQVMAEQEAVANVISSAVAERDSSDNRHSVHERFETKKSTFSEGPITTTQEVSTRVINSRQQVTKPMSPFAKFRQLDKQNSLNTPPSSPRTPTGSGAPFFKFTDPALSHSASTVKDRLLFWCQMKTKEYENVKLENFSTSWADGLAFCALIHHFLPNAFDYHALTPQQRRHNFTLAFKVADEQAGIYPLLDVDDMVAMRRPDWKCVFTYVQAIYRRFKDDD